jgi:sugar O-acyltransferase (sialic acid O-acetyltransferase NeuD family)
MGKGDRVFLFGASGHAKVVADIVERAGGTVTFIADDDPARAGQRLLGYSVIGGRAELPGRRGSAGLAIVAIGVNAARLSVAEWLADNGFAFATAIHPSAQVGREVRIGEGGVVMAAAAINSDTTLGAHCIVNTGASVDHDCVLGDGVHVAPGARLCGGVKVGRGTLVGAGAVVVPGCRIGSDAIIAAGAVVLADVPDGRTVAGNPARAVIRP